VRKLTTPVPPLEEQIRIVESVTLERRRIGALIERAQREIELIQEYRTRLISDVVTGKLDVRGVELPAIDEVVEAGMEDDLIAANKE
jgi:type I restriction enzyme, S subunit